MERKLRILIKIFRAVLEILEIELDERIRHSEHRLEDGKERDYNNESFNDINYR